MTINEVIDRLECAFVWDGSLKGHSYWEKVRDNLIAERDGTTGTGGVDPNDI